jgi:hypothetical protein
LLYYLTKLLSATYEYFFSCLFCLQFASNTTRSSRPESDFNIGSPENLLMKMSPFVRNVLETSRTNSSTGQGNASSSSRTQRLPSPPPSARSQSRSGIVDGDSILSNGGGADDSVSEKSAEMTAAQEQLEQRMRELEGRAKRLSAREDALRQFASSGELGGGGDTSSNSGSHNPFDYGDDPLTPIRPNRQSGGGGGGRSRSNLMKSFPPSGGRIRSLNKTQDMYDQMPAVAEATEVAIAVDMARTEAEMRGVQAEQ